MQRKGIVITIIVCKALRCVRRDELDILMLQRIEFGLYNIKLNPMGRVISGQHPQPQAHYYYL